MNRGYTAFELLVVVAIVAILAVAAIPFVLGQIQSSRIDGAVRQIVSDLRNAQSLAVSKGGCYGLHFGLDPLVGRPNEYRTETGGCDGGGWPAPSAPFGGNPNVISNWYNVPVGYQGISITSLRDNVNTNVNGVIFDSRGTSVNPFIAISHPVKITVSSTSGATKFIHVKAAGGVKVP
jgi:prepilin-type N-terminal cleavage/methylation domain-containing protein